MKVSIRKKSDMALFQTDGPDGVVFEGDWLPLVGLPVAEAKALLKDAVNVSYLADAFVNGSQVPVAYLLRPGDRLEFVQRFGFKAGDDLAAERELAEALLRAEPELARQVDDVSKLPLDMDEMLAVMALRSCQWAAKRFGPVTADAVALLNKLTKEFSRLAAGEQFPPGSRPTRLSISERVRIDIAGGKIVIDGVHHALDALYLAILDCLVAADGDLVSRAEMRNMKTLLKDDEHIERHIRRLKKINNAVGRLIETDERHRGFRIITDF